MGKFSRLEARLEFHVTDRFRVYQWIRLAEMCIFRKSLLLLKRPFIIRTEVFADKDTCNFSLKMQIHVAHHSNGK